MGKTFFSIFIFVFLSGCTTTAPKYAIDSGVEDGVPIHGNFCGKNIPTIKEKGSDSRISKLNLIDSYDEIDELCKQHDICYARDGYYNAKCDNILFESSLELSVKFESRECRDLSLMIGGYFRTVNMRHSRSVIEDKDAHLLFKTLMFPIAVASDAIEAIFAVFTVGVNSSMSMAGAVIDSSTPDRYVNVEYGSFPVPPRYYECNLINITI